MAFIPFFGSALSTPVTGLLDAGVDINLPDVVELNDIVFGLFYMTASASNTVDSLNLPDGWSFLDGMYTSFGVRRVVACYYAVGGYGAPITSAGGTLTFAGTTSSPLATTLGGCMVVVRDGMPIGGLENGGNAGITSSTAPAPSSITTTINESIALAAIAYDNTDTITAISGNNWAGHEVKNDGTNSYAFQYIHAHTAGTFSGGSATLGTSGNWGCITCSIRPRGVIS